ncbi:MAG TPA: hypothetical protein VFQ75_02820 [Candidatus Limnocylindrales bacterium]|nr:hypothetical protein [Candidatus Limnocylindrales bacterium]
MEARILPLPTPVPTPTAIGTAAPVRVDGTRIVIERLVLVDAALAASLADREPADRPAVVERALRIGLLALQDASTAMDVDVVRREFEKLVAQTTAVNESAARAVEDVLRANFADGDGRLPRTLEKFLGDRGALQQFVNELFDETRRDSAIGRIGGLLGTYFDGDRSKVAQLLDPTRLGSPLHQFRQEIAEGFKGVHERLAAIEAASRARADERARSAAKGGDFEVLLHGMLGDLARGSGDLVDRTGTETGALLGSKKGDFVLTLNAALTRGADVKVVLEAKDRVMSQRAMREELREARENRGAAVAVAVWTPAHAPAGVAPFSLVGDDVHVVIDPESPDTAYLEAAVRLARLLALATLQEREVDVDAAAIGRALAGVREQLEAIRALKTQLTSVSTATKAVWTGLETLRAGILARVAEAEAELRLAQVTPG